MRSYVVGGAVRDRLLGRPVDDRDHVVVGATVDDMLAAGFKPVGRDFPVFLHPKTHEEYALARTERKVAPGYAGFVFHADPSVTLEDDLGRRDLTINAIAEEEGSGRLIDPFGGQRDLALRLFRHVGPAFTEDPVRVLRVARFATKLVDFEVAPETLALMRAMAGAGEIDALVPERVWQELARGLMGPRPARMIYILRAADALARVLPELDALFTEEPEASSDRSGGDRVLRWLDRAAEAGSALEVRFAVLIHRAGALEALCARLAVPRAVRDVALLVAVERERLLSAIASEPSTERDTLFVEVLEQCDAFRRAGRFLHVVDAVASTIDDPDRRAAFSRYAVAAATAAGRVDAGAIARGAGYEPGLIADRLHRARVEAVAVVRAHDAPPR